MTSQNKIKSSNRKLSIPFNNNSFLNHYLIVLSYIFLTSFFLNSEIAYAQNWDSLWTGNHNNWVWAIALSPDSSRIVSSSTDHTIKVWDLNNGELLWTGNHDDKVQRVAFSPDGENIVSASDDYSIKLWDSETGDTLWTQYHFNKALRVAFSPDGSNIVSGGADHFINVWDSNDGGLKWRRRCSYSDWILSVAFSPVENKIVTGSADHYLKMWDSNTGDSLWAQNHDDDIWWVKFTPDGDYIASVGIDNTIRLWNSADGDHLWTGYHPGDVITLAVSPDGNKVVSGCTAGTIKLWKTSNGDSLWAVNHNSRVNSVAFSPDGNHIVSGSNDKTVKIWNVNDGNLLATNDHTDWVWTAKFSPDGNKVVSGSSDRTLKVWTDHKVVALKNFFQQKVNLVNSIIMIRWVSANIDYVKIELTTDNGTNWQTIAGSVDAIAGEWQWQIPETESSELCKIKISDASDQGVFDISDFFTIASPSDPEDWYSFWSYYIGDVVNDIVFSPDGSKIATASSNHITIWDTYTGMPVWIGYHFDAGVTAIAFSPNGEMVASGSYTPGIWDTLKVWDADNGNLIWAPENNRSINTISFNSDNSKIATGTGFPEGAGGKITVWNTIENFLWDADHGEWIYIVLFSPNGNQVVSAGEDTAFKVWNSDDGELLWSGVHTDDVYSVAFSPDGDRIVSGSLDNTVKVWDATAESLIWKGRHTDDVYAVSFSPDGSKIVSGSKDNVLKVWDSDNGDLLWIGDHPFGLNSTSFNYDGSRILAAGGEFLQIWDSGNGMLLWSGGFSSGGVFCPVSKMIVSNDLVDGITVWSSETQLQLTKPEGSDNLWTGTEYDIEWINTSDIEYIFIEYSTDGGNYWESINPNTGASNKSFSWTVPNPPSNSCFVRITDTENLAMFSQNSNPFTIFDYPEQITISREFTFGDITNSANYRIISLPGETYYDISSFMNGEQQYDWNAYTDYGDYGYLGEYYQGMQFYPGAAFWVLSNNPMNISPREESSVDLNNDRRTPIYINYSGWQLISNPFERSTLWEDVKDANNLEENQVIYSWQGGPAYLTPNEMQPYEGYYFNNYNGLQNLYIPYDPNGSFGKITSTSTYPIPIDDFLKIVVSEKDKARGSEVFIGINPLSKTGFDEKDYFSAPGDFQKMSITLIRNELSERNKNLFIEQRPKIGDGQEYDLEIKAVVNEPLRLNVDGINNFDTYEIYLLDERLKNIYNLKEENDLELRFAHQYNKFKLYIGKKNYIESKIKNIQPVEYKLYQNYPNPFNPQTVIRFSIPQNNKVTLRVYTILGELVKTIINNVNFEAGHHEVEFNSKDLASGIYLYRIDAGKLNESKKMILLK